MVAAYLPYLQMVPKAANLEQEHIDSMGVLRKKAAGMAMLLAALEAVVGEQNH